MTTVLALLFLSLCDHYTSNGRYTDAVVAMAKLRHSFGIWIFLLSKGEQHGRNWHPRRFEQAGVPGLQIEQDAPRIAHWNCRAADLCAMRSGFLHSAASSACKGIHSTALPRACSTPRLSVRLRRALTYYLSRMPPAQTFTHPTRASLPSGLASRPRPLRCEQ